MQLLLFDVELPVKYSSWNFLKRKLPSLVEDGSLVPLLQKLPVLDCCDLEDRYLPFASVILCACAHSFFFLTGSNDVPPPVLQPWQTICKRLGRPYVGRTSCEDFYWNVKWGGPHSNCTVKNLSVAVRFSSLETDERMVLCVVCAEFVFNKGLNIIRSLYERVSDGLNASLKSALYEVAQVVLEVERVFSDLLDLRDKKLDALLWGRSFGKVGKAFLPREKSNTGSEISLFHVLDAFFGFVGRKSTAAREMQEREPSLPHGVLNLVENVRSIDFFTLSKQCNAESVLLQAQFNYQCLLQTHRRFAYAVMLVTVADGRVATNASMETVNARGLNEKLRAGFEERFLGSPSTWFVCQKAEISRVEDGALIQLDVGGLALSIEPGAACHILSKNCSSFDALSEKFGFDLQREWRTDIWDHFFHGILGRKDYCARDCLLFGDFKTLNWRDISFIDSADFLDKVLVMDHGKMKELLEPEHLFSSLKPLYPKFYSVASFDGSRISLFVHAGTKNEGQEKSRIVRRSSSTSLSLHLDPLGTFYCFRIKHFPRFSLSSEDVSKSFIFFASLAGVGPFIFFIEELLKKGVKVKVWLFVLTRPLKFFFFSRLVEFSSHANIHIYLHSVRGKQCTELKTMSKYVISSEKGFEFIHSNKDLKRQLQNQLECKTVKVYVCGSHFAGLCARETLLTLCPAFDFTSNFYEQIFEDRQRERADTVVLRSELRSHRSSNNDTWTVINSYIFSLQSYLSKHPGGRQCLLLYGGLDMTHSFEAAHYDQSYVNDGALSRIGRVSTDSFGDVYEKIDRICELICERENLFFLGRQISSECPALYRQPTVAQFFSHTLPFVCSLLELECPDTSVCTIEFSIFFLDITEVQRFFKVTRYSELIQLLEQDISSFFSLVLNDVVSRMKSFETGLPTDMDFSSLNEVLKRWMLGIRAHVSAFEKSDEVRL